MFCASVTDNAKHLYCYLIIDQLVYYIEHDAMNKFIPKRSDTLSFFIPALYTICILMYDFSEPFRTVTPTLCTIGLLVLAVFLRPVWIATWAIIYSIIVTKVLLDQRIFGIMSAGFQPPEMVSHKFRVAGFVVVALFSVIFSYLLNRLRNKQKQLNHLILKMPLPILISNSDGNVILMNDKAHSFLEIEDKSANTTYNFFDLLAPKRRQGKCISAYLKAFQEGTDRNDRLELENRGTPIVAHIELLDTHTPQLITILPDNA